MRTTIIVGALGLLLLPVTASAQEKKPPSPFGETIEVHVINVDVVVTGKDGKPVRGLTKDDFELFENGAKRDISNFAEVDSPVTAAPSSPATASAPAPASVAPAAGEHADLRSRKIVLFLDESSLRPFNRNKVLTAARGFLQQIVRPNDQVMLLSWRPGLQVEMPFSSDTNTLTEKLAAIEKTSTSGTALFAEEQRVEKKIARMPADFQTMVDGKVVNVPPPFALALSDAQAFAMRLSHEQNEKTAAITGVMATLRGMEGRKALVLVTERLDENPGASIFQFLESLKDKFAGGGGFSWMSAAGEFTDRLVVSKITSAANSAGVTFYSIDAAGLGGDLEGMAADRLSNEFATTSAPGFKHSDETFQAVRKIASATGGTALTASNNFQLAFDTIRNDLLAYYSIGYRANGGNEDAVRTIEVKLRNPRAGAIRTRQAFVERSTASEIGDIVAANLFYPVAKNDLNVRMKASAGAAPAADQRVVPVDITIPTASLTLLPDGTDLHGSFSTYTAFIRADGVVSEIKHQQHQLRFPAESLKRRKEITLHYDLSVDARTDGVSVGVMDDASHTTGFAALKFEPAA
ncbi:MAG TPA: VWA domain-containing protein [Thermoanaerobaculia bacterium]|nr:VWA domain-containing protein [Thermoanaerobaculia bacterium]